MKFRFNGSLLAVISISMFATASFASRYPTRWKIFNHTPSDLHLKCECPSPLGLNYPIEMHVDKISAKSEHTYVWDGWYNDGLGLNPCQWDCSAGAESDPSSHGSGHFSTNWGESITVAITGQTGAFVIQKK